MAEASESSPQAAPADTPDWEREAALMDRLRGNCCHTRYELHGS